MPASSRTARAPSPGAVTVTANVSLGLEWLWQQLQDDRQPKILDCGRMQGATMRALLEREAKVYVADLLSAFRPDAPDLWDRSQDPPVFRLGELLRQVPPIPSGSLSAVFSWQLFDLIPASALPELVERILSYLRPGGVLFCLLRDSNVREGAETRWCLEALSTLRKDGDGAMPFAYPPVTNRQIEGLMLSANVKTFLTRFGWREVLVRK